MAATPKSDAHTPVSFQRELVQFPCFPPPASCQPRYFPGQCTRDDDVTPLEFFYVSRGLLRHAHVALLPAVISAESDPDLANKSKTICDVERVDELRSLYEFLSR